jgi:hypothetical protein
MIAAAALPVEHYTNQAGKNMKDTQGDIILS